MSKRRLGTLNNRQRAAQAAHERMDAVTYAHLRRDDGRHVLVPLRYLSPDERCELLSRATSPLEPV